MQAVLAVLSALGVALVFLCTSRYGVGLSPDSANYLSAARSLLSGTGFRYSDGGIYTHWPPLFPALLAGFGLVGIEPQTAARFLNAFAFGAIVFVSGRLFLRCTTSNAFAILGTLSIVLSAPLLTISAMALSEPVFILLAALFVLYMGAFLHTRRWTLLWVVSILAALACLQRYAGVTLIMTGCILLALCTTGASLWERMKYLVSFGAISSTPLAVWIVRNRMVAGETAGAHHFHLGSGRELGRSMMSAADVVAPWLFPRVPSVTVEMVGLGLILLAAGIAVVVARRTLRDPDDAGSSMQIGSVAVFGLVYCGFLVVSGAGLSWNPNERVMLPAYMFIMLLVFTGVGDASRLLTTLPTGRRWGEWSGLGLCILWLLYPLSQTDKCVGSRIREGAGEFSSPVWQESPLIQWLRENPLQGAAYSNVPGAVYLLAGVPAKTTPHYYWDTTQFAGNMSSSRANYIIWSENLHLDFLYDLRELASRWQMAEVAAFSDGAVYRFLGDGGRGIFGVHRFWNPQKGRHYYTLNKREIETINLHQGRQWRDEGAVFYVYSCDQHPAHTLPVHQFSSEALESRFYTMQEVEKDTLIREYSQVWRYDGVAWYAYPAGEQPAEARPVFRLWSDTLQTHFYTIEEAERDWLVRGYPQVWRYEGVVWYAYGK